MKSEVCRITTALNEAAVRYVVAGGLAVIAHGYLRATLDIDLVIDLERENLNKALEVLEHLGFHPRLPLSKEQLADPEIRAKWAEKKGMVVFPLWNPEDPAFIVDIFIRCPFDFDVEYQKAAWIRLDEHLEIPFVSRETLIRMKKEVGRTRDLEDIEHLELEA
jgi:hypothetical protein